MTEAIKQEVLAIIGTICDGLTPGTEILVLGTAMGNLTNTTRLIGEYRDQEADTPGSGLTEEEAAFLRAEMKKASEKVTTLI